jgi:hypothetical protein
MEEVNFWSSFAGPLKRSLDRLHESGPHMNSAQLSAELEQLHSLMDNRLVLLTEVLDQLDKERNNGTTS